MVKPIVDEGTDEQAWRDWTAPRSWPPLAWEPPGEAAAPLSVAPHPDAEILGVGGLLAMLTATGGKAEVAVVTDGEASHPGSTVHSQQELAAIRRAETSAACATLGVDPSCIQYVGQPDGGIDESALTDLLCRQLVPGRWCLTTWRGDGHPDHEAVARAAAVVL